MTELIGILGGSFDPVHQGHVRIAEYCCEQLELDQIRLVPVAQPAHRETLVASVEQRLAMLQLAIIDKTKLMLDDIEIKRAGVSYTIDTLKQIKATQAKAILFFIMGEDAFSVLHKWKQWQTLFDYAHIIILDRAVEQNQQLHPTVAKELQKRLCKNKKTLHKNPAGLIFQLHFPPIDISSTKIRQHAHEETAKNLLAAKVYDYIQTHQLY